MRCSEVLAVKCTKEMIRVRYSAKKQMSLPSGPDVNDLSSPFIACTRKCDGDLALFIINVSGI